METTFELLTLEQLKAFSHPVRYQVINLLILNPMTGAQLARSLKMPRQRMHYHIRILRQAGLILPVNEPENQSSLEIYYRSVAGNFSSPLLSNVVTTPTEEATSQLELRQQTIHDLIITMTEQVKSDLNQRDSRRRQSHLGSSFQHTVFLTQDQIADAHDRFQEIKNALLAQTEQNLARGARQDFVSLRYTLLVTPCFTGDEH